jgi:hypothetical protein
MVLSSTKIKLNAWLSPSRSGAGPILSRLLWPLPACAHDWIEHYCGGRPARVCTMRTVDANGKRHVTRAEYLWEPTILMRAR